MRTSPVMIDYRCTFSGVSLLGSDCMAVIVAMPSEDSPDARPIALPLFGRYDGSGTLVDINEGDNAQRILAAFVRDLTEGTATIDWGRLGFSALPIDHVETLLGLLSANVIHRCDAISWCGLKLGVVFFEGNVAAALMQREPLDLASVVVEDLPSRVLASGQLVASIYGTLRQAGPSLRCKYGLSAVALSSLCEAMGRWDRPWSGGARGYVRDQADPARFLAEAYRDFSSDEDLVDALAEYSAEWGDAEDD